MEPEITTIESFKIVGAVYYGDPRDGEIPEFWNNHWDIFGDIETRVGEECYGFCFHTDDYYEKGKMHYMLCVRVKDFSYIPMKGVGKLVPTMEYAIFTHVGDHENLKNTYDYINGIYFPNKKYKAD